MKQKSAGNTDVVSCKHSFVELLVNDKIGLLQIAFDFIYDRSKFMERNKMDKNNVNDIIAALRRKKESEARTG